MRRRFVFAFAGVCLAIQGCSTLSGFDRSTPRNTGPAPHDRRLNPQQQSLADASCYGGLPIDTGAAIGSTEVVIRQGYVLEHSSVDKIPLWVCESVVADQLTGHLRRRNRFQADPDLQGRKSYPSDYAGSGYDRGHQAPAGNQTKDPMLKDQTFYMSNMAPQRPSLNRGIWKVLEDRTREWVIRYGHAYEWTGPIRCDPKMLNRATSQESCQRHTIGKNAVAVPTYFYKIVLVQDQTKWKAIAFVMPNQDFERPYQLETYIKSIDWIEQQTGIEFMPNVDLRERRALKSVAASMWP
jgi:endonuclease G, mitochondrial